jgi:hypothetical protein
MTEYKSNVSPNTFTALLLSCPALLSCLCTMHKMREKGKRVGVDSIVEISYTINRAAA